MNFKEAKTNPIIMLSAAMETNNNLVAKILANRLDSEETIKDVFNPTSALLNSSSEIYDETVKEAANLVTDVLFNKGRIVLVTDSDCDGVSSASVGKIFFRKAYGLNVKVIVNERRFGNGVNDEMIRRILEEHQKDPIELIITADHGSSDDIRYKKLKDVGIKVLVTDHHLLPNDKRLVNVDAFVNPHRYETTINKNISGCAVLYLVFKAMEENAIGDKELKYLLPIVAMSTIVDQMSLKDPLNRYFFKRGMEIIESGDDELWVNYLKKTNSKFDKSAEFFSRGIGPIINAANRMGKPWLAYKFLTAENEQDLEHYLSLIIGLNDDRKNLQKELMKLVIDQVKKSNMDNHHSLTAILPDAEGIVGVIASMIGEQNLKPAFVFSPHGDYLSGSGRAIINNVSIKVIIDYIKDNSDGLIVKGGGHKGAGGVKIVKSRYNEFVELFEKSVKDQTGGKIEDIIEYDFFAPLEYLNASMLEIINSLEPFGQHFPIVKIRTTAKFESVRRLGLSEAHLCKITNGKVTIEAIMFKAPKDKELKGKTKDIIIRLYEKQYRGIKSLGFEILYILDQG